MLLSSKNKHLENILFENFDGYVSWIYIGMVFVRKQYLLPPPFSNLTFFPLLRKLCGKNRVQFYYVMPKPCTCTLMWMNGENISNQNLYKELCFSLSYIWTP
jgi:hypothetical protein